jgi:UDP-N-acetylglucosamine--N-acetylmuramyl-(pentapeptide) pyrophosphoryl-undecaprenol N-acetylglucosamine transferase
MKLMVSAGGTGGHVYPALAVVKAISGRGKPSAAEAVEVLWVGGKGGIEEGLIAQAGLPFVGLAAGGLRGMGPLVQVRNASRLAGGFWQARGVLARFRPDVVLSTGGYASVAVTLAAWLKRIPVVIYLPDIVPGQAIQTLSRFAARIAVTSEESRRYFDRNKVVVTGYPVRPEILTLSKAEARQALGLGPEAKVLLVFGGSQGARSINQAVIAGLPSLLSVCEVVHISGRLDAEWVAEAGRELPEGLRARYHHYDYLHDMPLALVAADLAVARAGAATLGEFPAAGLPAVLVPYPYSGQHQNPNAEYMARNGAARVLSDAELGEKLVPTLLELLDDAPAWQALVAMQASARALARPDAAEAIAGQLQVLAGRARGRRATEAEP